MARNLHNRCNCAQPWQADRPLWVPSYRHLSSERMHACVRAHVETKGMWTLSTHMCAGVQHVPLTPRHFATSSSAPCGSQSGHAADAGSKTAPKFTALPKPSDSVTDSRRLTPSDPRQRVLLTKHCRTASRVSFRRLLQAKAALAKAHLRCVPRNDCCHCCGRRALCARSTLLLMSPDAPQGCESNRACRPQRTRRWAPTS